MEVSYMVSTAVNVVIVLCLLKHQNGGRYIHVQETNGIKTTVSHTQYTHTLKEGRTYESRVLQTAIKILTDMYALYCVVGLLPHTVILCWLRCWLLVIPV